MLVNGSLNIVTENFCFLPDFEFIADIDESKITKNSNDFEITDIYFDSYMVTKNYENRRERVKIDKNLLKNRLIKEIYDNVINYCYNSTDFASDVFEKYRENYDF